MKFAGYLTEAKVSKEKIKKILDRDCAKFLKEMKGEYDLLFRGSYMKIDRIAKVKHNKNRSPKDTPQELHDHLNEMFKKKFGWPVRSGIFTVPNRSTASKYGDTFNFFPIGDYKYVYSKEVTDLFQEFEDEGVTTFFSDDKEYDNEYIFNQYVDEYSDKIVKHIKVAGGKGMEFETDDGEIITNIGKYMDRLEKQGMELEVVPVYEGGWSFVVYDRTHGEPVKTIYLIDWNKMISIDQYKDKMFGKVGSVEAKSVDGIIERLIKTYKTTGLYDQATSLRPQSMHEITFWCNYYYLVDDKIFGHHNNDEEGYDW